MTSGKKHRVLMLIVLLVMLFDVTLSFNESFEDHLDGISWRTAPKPNDFSLASGMEKAGDKTFPQTDTTRGDEHVSLRIYFQIVPVVWSFVQ
ncbi:hypothetical protein BaRGS_00015258, partial [Batillaria attramentaria]